MASVCAIATSGLRAADAALHTSAHNLANWRWRRGWTLPGLSNREGAVRDFIGRLLSQVVGLHQHHQSGHRIRSSPQDGVLLVMTGPQRQALEKLGALAPVYTSESHQEQERPRGAVASA